MTANDGIWAVLIVNVFGFMTVIINSVVTSRKAEAEREDALEMARQTAKSIADQLAEKTKADIESEERIRRYAREDRAELLNRHEKVLVKLDAVAEKADAAYQEANQVNLKIADIGLKVADGTALEPKKPTTRKVIKE